MDGAIAFYEQAVERGPRWVDPQQFWGEALMAQSDDDGSIRKYRAAADRADAKVEVFLSVFVLSFIERFCLAGLPLRLVRSVHYSSTASLTDQFAADDQTAPLQPSRGEELHWSEKPM